MNAAAEISASWDAHEALAQLHAVEALAERVREVRWAQRSLDLDLLAFGDLVLPDVSFFQRWHDLPLAAQLTHTPDRLILPHPRLQDRAFVLAPLMDIAADWAHPVLHRTVAQMYADLPQAEKEGVLPLV